MIIKIVPYSFALILLVNKSVSHNIPIKNDYSLTPRIHGGLQAESAGQFSYQVSLRLVWSMPFKTFQSQHYCGGALISDR